jgi:hypothetical protein
MNTAVAKLPSPPIREGDAPHASESHHLIRERSFSASSSIDSLIRTLRSERVTGTLTIDFNQGGIGSVTFKEKKKIAFE